MLPVDIVRTWLDNARTDLCRRGASIGFLFGETVKLWMGGAPASSGPAAIASVPDRASAIDTPDTEAETAQGRTPLQEWRALAKRTFFTVAAFSIFVNLLMLTVPIYLFQLSDRVLTSRSIDTLFMLSMLAITFLAVLSLLDICRRQVLGALANRLETILGGHLLASVISTPQSLSGSATEAIGDLGAPAIWRRASRAPETMRKSSIAW